MTINELCTAAHKNAKENGFYDGNPSFGALLMQVVEELGEASNADRKGRRETRNLDPVTWIKEYEESKDELTRDRTVEFYDAYLKDTVESEIADAFIILAGICKHMDIDIGAHIQAKMRYNRTRERLHGKEY